jgi:hypothetical protein
MTSPAPATPAFAVWLFDCPCCGQSNTYPQDVTEGYCSLCHWQTGDPQLGPWHMERPCRWRYSSTPHTLARPGL